MCVIVIKDKNKRFDFDTLTKMWTKNPDGAGLAYFDEEGRVEVMKGIMKPLELHDILEKLYSKEVVVHFRYATRGVTNEHQTHPFVITKSVKRAKGISGRNKNPRSVLFHNGTVSGYGCDKISDTIDFVVKTLSRIPTLETKLDVLELEGSKYALLEGGEVYTVGYFHEYMGLWCSNLNWQKWTPSKTTTTTYTSTGKTNTTDSKPVALVKHFGNVKVQDWEAEYRRHERYLNGEMGAQEELEYENLLYPSGTEGSANDYNSEVIDGTEYIYDANGRRIKS